VRRRQNWSGHVEKRRGGEGRKIGQENVSQETEEASGDLDCTGVFLEVLVGTRE